MNFMSLPNARLTGADLFNGFESLMQDLSETDEAMISGGGRSNSGRRRKQRRRKQRRKGQSRSFSGRSRS